MQPKIFELPSELRIMKVRMQPGGIIELQSQLGIIKVRMEPTVNSRSATVLGGTLLDTPPCALIGLGFSPSFPDVTIPNENRQCLLFIHTQSEYEAFILAENNNIFLWGGANES